MSQVDGREYTNIRYAGTTDLQRAMSKTNVNSPLVASVQPTLPPQLRKSSQPPPRPVKFREVPL